MLRLPRFASEVYEANISRLVMRIRGNLAVDVGAQNGHYTIQFASHFERVISVEPSPINLPILRQRLKRLKLENVRIVASAIGDFEGETEVYRPREHLRGCLDCRLGHLGTSASFSPESLLCTCYHSRYATSR